MKPYLLLDTELADKLRDAYKQKPSVPVMITPFNGDEPQIRGMPARAVTAKGTPVVSANAYRRSGGHPVMLPSTLRITVGEYWLCTWAETSIVKLRLASNFVQH